MKNPFLITVLTLYPEMFPNVLGFAIANKGKQNNLWNLRVINIRDFSLDKHKKVDDYVYGGGKGLLLKPDVLGRAIEYAFETGSSKNLVYPNPKGEIFTTQKAKSLSQMDGLTFICGHFEGIDQRIIDKYHPMQISIGDYILSGGELSSVVIIDSTLRFIPNMLKSFECVEDESFNNNLLEYSQYTKPYDWQGLKVPDVLLSGNHKEIEKWKLAKSEEITELSRSDLWKKYITNKSE